MILCSQCEDLSKILLVSKFETNWPYINVAPYSFTIACTHGTNLRALEGNHKCFFYFYDVNMSTKSKTDSEISRGSFGEIP